MKSITINRDKRLREEPHTGHNRWHPDIAPIETVAPGELIRLELCQGILQSSVACRNVQEFQPAHQEIGICGKQLSKRAGVCAGAAADELQVAIDDGIRRHDVSLRSAQYDLPKYD